VVGLARSERDRPVDVPVISIQGRLESAIGVGGASPESRRVEPGHGEAVQRLNGVREGRVELADRHARLAQ